MCGRFVQKTPLGDIRVLFETVNPVPNAPPRYHAAPTQDLAVVRYNHDRPHNRVNRWLGVARAAMPTVAPEPASGGGGVALAWRVTTR